MPEWLESAWLQRYLDRQLSDPESEWFEAYMLDKPHLIDAIEADTNLRDGLVGANGTPAGRHAIGSQRRGSRSAWLRAATNRAAPMAWAASLVLAWVVGWMFAGLNPGGSADTRALVVASPTRLVFDTLRGVETPPLVHPGDPDSQHILVEVGLPSDAEAISLILPDSATALPLVLSPDGFVTVLLPRQRLTATTPLRIAYRSAGTEHERALALPTES